MELNVDQAKLVAIVLLGGGSFFVGMLPAMASPRFQERHKLLFTFLLCFGAGVLLATSIVHILTEVQETLPHSAAIYFCGGFLLMSFVDMLYHLFFDHVPGHSHAHAGTSGTSATYGSVESDSLLAATDSGSESNPRSDPRNCPRSTSSGKFGLLCALSLHSFLEGLAIGVQDTSAKVLLLITAVACHKYVVGFCMGLEVSSSTEQNSNRSSFWTLFISMSIFALGSILGIALGMVLVDFKELWTSSTIPILQALAGGTLLFVTLSEVLPREKAKFHGRSKWAIVLQFIACLLGFVLMTILNAYLVEPESSS